MFTVPPVQLQPEPKRMLHSLDDSSNAHTAANAERNQTRGQVTPLQLIQHGAQEHRAGGADWVAEGDRSTIHVHLLWIDLQVAHSLERYYCKGFIDFPQVDVLHAHA